MRVEETPRFSVVLFDLDGTLIDTNHLIVTCFQYVLKEKLGLDVPPEALYKHFGEILPKTMSRYCPERAIELADFYRAYNIANHDRLIRRFEGVSEALAQLRRAGVKLGVVTSKRRDMALRGLQACGIQEDIDVVVGMDESEKHKPAPEPVYLALQRLGAEPGDHVLMVGDSHFDILCGKNAGVRTAAVRWTVLDQAELEAVSPDYWVETPAELVRLILGQ